MAEEQRRPRRQLPAGVGSVIPEAAVEAVAKALWDMDRTSADREYEGCRDGAKRHLRREASAMIAALSAAGFGDKAQAWKDGREPGFWNGREAAGSGDMEHQVTTAPSITEFLEARIAEDEAVAREALEPKNLHPYGDTRIPAIKPDEWGGLVDNYLGGTMGVHSARHDPTRVLAECAAKRAIIGGLEPFSTLDDINAPELLSILAAVYAEHPDYRQDWAL